MLATVLVILSIVLGALAVLLMPVSNQEKIRRWVLIEIVGTLAAALVMWIVLLCSTNPKWQRSYNEACNRLKEFFRGKKQTAQV